MKLPNGASVTLPEQALSLSERNLQLWVLVVDGVFFSHSEKHAMRHFAEELEFGRHDLVLLHGGKVRLFEGKTCERCFSLGRSPSECADRERYPDDVYAQRLSIS